MKYLPLKPGRSGSADQYRFPSPASRAPQAVHSSGNGKRETGNGRRKTGINLIATSLTARFSARLLLVSRTDPGFLRRRNLAPVVRMNSTNPVLLTGWSIRSGNIDTIIPGVGPVNHPVNHRAKIKVCYQPCADKHTW